MKTTFGRTICTTVIILLAALLLLGTSFQASVKEYLTETVVSNLQENATALSELASAYYSEGSLNQREFMVNLDIASRISNVDIVISDNTGKVILCSNSVTGCDHHNLHIDLTYLDKVFENQGDRATGLIPGLYDESRFVTTMPIYDDETGEALGIVMVFPARGKFQPDPAAHRPDLRGHRHSGCGHVRHRHDHRGPPAE